MLLRTCCLAIVVLAGCRSTGDGGAGATAATSSTVATTPSIAVSTPATTAAKPSSPPAPASVGKPVETLTLASGAVLKMPKGAVSSPMKNAATRLPSVVKAAHKLQLGDKQHLLLVNEMDREGLACKAVLDRELERANKAKADTDEKKRSLRKMKRISEVKIGEHRALYAISKNRPPTPGTAEADKSQPMLGVATLIMCRGQDYVVMMYASDQSSLPEDTKKMLLAIASSYTPPS